MGTSVASVQGGEAAAQAARPDPEHTPVSLAGAGTTAFARSAAPFRLILTLQAANTLRKGGPTGASGRGYPAAVSANCFLRRR